MKVRAIREYYDLELKKSVKVGDELTVSAARGKALSSKNNKAGYILCEVIEADATTTTTEKVVEAKAEAKTEAKAETEPKKRATKKTTKK